MDRHYFIELLHKYHKGEATKEEVQFLISYYNLFQSEPDGLSFLSGEQKDATKREIHQAVWDNIYSKQQPEQAKLRRINGWKLSIAAASIALILFAARLFLVQDQPVKAKPVASLSKLANVNHVITLPDGSTVILNTGSKLNYPSSFDSLGKREVFLDGQAYFDVKHNPSSPFIVHAGKLNVTVLGTAFNIKAFPVDKDITVTVKRGKVSVSDNNNQTLGTITPRQQIVYNNEKKNAMLLLVNNDHYIDWKEQDLLFDNLTVSEAATLLEERFKVKILIMDQSVRSERFTASFPKNQSLEEALKSICEFNGAVYHYDKKQSTVIIANK